MSDCKGGFIVREGQYVEIYRSSDKKLLASFKVKSNMCKRILDRYLVFNCNVSRSDLDYFVKVISRG